MNEYNKQMKAAIDHLNSIRFPCEDWKADKEYFDRLERKFSREPEDEAGQRLQEELKQLISAKRTSSMNCNKTTEELFAGWND